MGNLGLASAAVTVLYAWLYRVFCADTVLMYDGEELAAIVGTFCPNLLFPYARETIAATIQKGGFPEFVLQPINFDALYAQASEEATRQ